MRVEYLVAYLDHTWDTQIHEIGNSNPEEWGIDNLEEFGSGVVLVSVYHQSEPNPILAGCPWTDRNGCGDCIKCETDKERRE